MAWFRLPSFFRRGSAKDAPSVRAEAPARMEQLRALSCRLEINIRDLTLLDQALTHASISADTQRRARDYESLEFLGDAVLGLAIAHDLFDRTPDRTPGEYSRMRAALVNGRCLAHIAQELDIASAIRLGKSEEHVGGRDRASLLADCVEALIAVVYLDQGWDAARRFIDRVFSAEIERHLATERVWDFKSRLQNYCQAEHMGLPEFLLVRSKGPDHKKEFEVEVRLRGEPAGQGRGSSKKEAEQNAARAALERDGVHLGGETPAPRRRRDSADPASD